MKKLLLLPLLFCCFYTSGQGWYKSFGASANESAYKAIQTVDGGFIMAGHTTSYGAGGSDVLVVKTDLNGRMQWQQVIGGAGNDTAFAIVQNPAGEYYVAGSTSSYGAGLSDLYLVKLNSSGSILWYNTFGTTLTECGRDLVLTPTGEVLITGFTNGSGAGGSDFYLVKASSTGLLIWQKTYGKTGNEGAFGMGSVHDGGFILSGSTTSFGTSYGYVVRTNSNGDTLWTKAYNIGTNQGTSLRGGAEMSGDSAFVFTGIGGTSLYSDLVALRVNLSGTVISTTYGPFLAASGADLVPTSDGGFIAVGSYSNFGTRTLMAKYSALNVLQWQKYFLSGPGQTYSYFGQGYSIQRTTDGGYVIAGNTYLPSGGGDFLLIKTDSLGNTPSEVVNNCTASGPLSFCSGGSVMLSVPSGYDTYQWVKFTSGATTWISGATGNTYLATTSDGFYCVMTNDTGILRSNTITVTATAIPAATISPSGTLNTCLASSPVTLTANTVAGAAYQWYLNNSPISGATASTYSPTASGSYIVSITNSCGSSTSPAKIINGTQGPSASISLNGSPWILFNTNLGSTCFSPTMEVLSQAGSTYTWYWNGNVFGGTGNTQPVYGTGNYYASVTNACGTSVTNPVVSISTMNVTAYTQSYGPVSGCGVTSAVLYPDAANNVIQWYLNGSPIPGATGSTYTATVSGNYSCDIEDWCAGAPVFYQTAPITVTINTTPVPSISASGNTTVCSGGVLLSASVAGATYQWKKDNTTISGATSQTYNAIATGSYTCVITNAACGTNTSNAIYVKVGAPSGTISGGTSVCSGSATTLSLSTSDGASITSRQWRLNGSPISGANAATYSASAAGTYDLQITNACSTVTTNAVTVTVNPVPTASVTPSGAVVLCPGSNMLLTAATGTGYTYQWYKNSVVVSGATSSTYTVTATGSYYVRVTLNGCAVNSNTVSVTQGVLPVSNIWGSTPFKFCSGGGVQLNANTGSGYTYLWYLNGSSLGISTPTYTASAAGNYHVVITNSSGCTASAPAVSLISLSVPAVSFTGLASSYQVSSPAVTLTGTPTGGTFSGPGISGNTFTPSVAGSGGPYTITYSYTGTNGCTGTASQQTSVLSCTLPGMPGTITASGGNTKVCPGDSKTYSITAVSGATSYTWTPPVGAVILSGQGTTSVNVSYTTGFVAGDTLRVKSVNACGSSANRILKISRNNPARPATVIGESFGMCNVIAIPYSVTPVAGMTYNWYFNSATAVVASGQGTEAITADFLSGFTYAVLSVTASNACGTSSVRTKNIYARPATPAAITGATSVCANQQDVPYSISALPTANSYTWLGPVGSLISDGITTSISNTFTTSATSVTIDYGTSAGYVKVRGNNACASGAYKSVAISIVCRDEAVLTGDAEGITLLPNPNGGQFTVITERELSESAVYVISDMLGKTIATFENVSSEFSVNLPELKPGVYMVTLIDKSKTWVRKMVVQE